MQTNRTRLGWALALLVWSGHGGCGPVSLAPGSFAPQFDCASARLAPSPGGYRLEGCGQIAFFHCRWSEQERLRGEQPRNAYSRIYPTVYWTPQRAPEGDGFVATREGVDQSTTPQLCSLESQREMSEAERAAEVSRLAPSAAAARMMASGGPRDAKVRTKAHIMGGRVELLSAPRAGDDHLLLSIQGAQSFKLDETCRIHGIVEATPLTIEAARQTSPHEVQLLLPAAALRGLDGSSRFFGSVCGHRFDLDEQARRTLAKYELMHP